MTDTTSLLSREQRKGAGGGHQGSEVELYYPTLPILSPPCPPEYHALSPLPCHRGRSPQGAALWIVALCPMGIKGCCSLGQLSLIGPSAHLSLSKRPLAYGNDLQTFTEVFPGTGFYFLPQSGRLSPSSFQDTLIEMWEQVGGGSPELPSRVCYMGPVGQTWVKSHFLG